MLASRPGTGLELFHLSVSYSISQFLTTHTHTSYTLWDYSDLHFWVHHVDLWGSLGDYGYHHQGLSAPLHRDVSIFLTWFVEKRLCVKTGNCCKDCKPKTVHMIDKTTATSPFGLFTVCLKPEFASFDSLRIFWTQK